MAKQACQIRNDAGQSHYFGGQFRGYGRYQWNIKHYGFESSDEIEQALLWAFGDHVRVGKRADNGNAIYGFDGISDLLGRSIESFIAGRSGGWLVIDTQLTAQELRLVDRHVKACMKALPAFLAEERELRATELADENTNHAED